MPTRVTISGNNFFAVSDVLFGANRAVNWDVNAARNTIVAEVPSGVTYDTIKVISNLRQKTGESPYKFAPTPTVDGYWGTSSNELLSNGAKVSGAYVPSGSIVIYGKNFSGVTGVYINNVNCKILNYVEPNSQIEVLLASGQLNSFIRLRGYSGINKGSSFSFEPQVYISGLSGDVNGYFLTGRLIHVSGRFFIPQTLSQFDPDVYSLKIGNGSRFNAYIKNPYALTGIVPAGSVDGVVQTQVITEKWNGNPNVIAKIAKLPVPIGNDLYNQRWYYPSETRVTGFNLDFVTGVYYRLNSQIQNPDVLGYDIYTGDTWEILTGWSSTNRSLIVPSTGIRRAVMSGLISGYANYYGILMDLAVMNRYGSGICNSDTISTNTSFYFNPVKQRESSQLYLYQHPIYFSGRHNDGGFSITIGQNGFISGSGILQRRHAFFNTPTFGVQVEYAFSGVSGWNWYASGISPSGVGGAGAIGFSQQDLLGYGLPRLFRHSEVESWRIPLGISGIRNNDGTYIFNTGIYYFPYTMRGSDGFVTGFTGRVYISTGRYI